MRNTWAVCKREFVSYFITPVGYVVAGVFALISGIGFAASFIGYARATQSPSAYGYTGVPDFEETLLSPFLVFCGLLIMFIGPLATTAPAGGGKEPDRRTVPDPPAPEPRDRVWQIRRGARHAAGDDGRGVDSDGRGVVFRAPRRAGGAGIRVITVFLMGAAFLSMGLFVSSITRQPGDGRYRDVWPLVWPYVLGSLSRDLPDAIALPENWSPWAVRAASFGYSIFRSLATELPLDVHAQEMAQGVLQPEDILYYVLFSAFWLFLTLRVLETRLWRA